MVIRRRTSIQMNGGRHNLSFSSSRTWAMACLSDGNVCLSIPSSWSGYLGWPESLYKRKPTALERCIPESSRVFLSIAIMTATLCRADVHTLTGGAEFHNESPHEIADTLFALRVDFTFERDPR